MIPYHDKVIFFHFNTMFQAKKTKYIQAQKYIITSSELHEIVKCVSHFFKTAKTIYVFEIQRKFNADIIKRKDNLENKNILNM